VRLAIAKATAAISPCIHRKSQEAARSPSLRKKNSKLGRIIYRAVPHRINTTISHPVRLILCSEIGITMRFIYAGSVQYKLMHGEGQMPTVLRVKGYRFFFFSLEGKEPPHIHVEQAERYAKIWLEPVSIARAKGFRSSELTEFL